MIRSIQYLRGIAAFLVLLHHIAFKLRGNQISILSGLHAADIGVDMFFIISGFIMCHSVRDRHGSSDEVWHFLGGRIARIVPLYWILTTVALCVYLLHPSLVNSSGGHTYILSSYFLLPVNGKYLNQNGWTLAFEFLFYLIFSLGLCIDKVVGRLLVISILSCLAITGFIFNPTGPWTSFIFNQFLIEFVAGMLLYMLYEGGFRFDEKLSIVGLIGASLLFVLGVNLGNVLGIRVVDYGVPAWLFCAALVLGYKNNGYNLLTKALEWLGDVSYSLYLLHPFIVAGVVVVMRRLFPVGLLSQFIELLVMIVGSLLGARLLFSWIEKPSVRWVRNYFLTGNR